MSFYDDSRIRYKNNKYARKRAYEIVHSLQSMGYSGQQLHTEIEKLLASTEAEFQKDILTIAMEMAKASKEIKDDQTCTRNFSFVNGRIQPAPSKKS